jgi:hypothetical protein
VSGRPKQERSATEQPGNSFKYLYWRLSKEEFQQLCGAILKAKYDPLQCFPVGMADGGIDAIAKGSIVFQVKWTSKFEQNPHAWLKDTIDGERENIKRMIRERGVTRYVLMTSVAGTTTAERTGSINKLDLDLAAFTTEFGIPVECMWQVDIDAEVDLAAPELKWQYADMLAGVDAIRYLMVADRAVGRAAEMRETLVAVMRSQWDEDAKVRFSQVDLNQKNLNDLFVDVPCTVAASPSEAFNRLLSEQDQSMTAGGEGALRYLMASTYPYSYLLGAPGQGKSTISQYLCQIHRASLLPGADVANSRPSESLDSPKMPLRVDLRDYGSWLSGHDPFGGDLVQIGKTKARGGTERSLECFLADFCRYHSGGRSVTVEHIQDFTERYPTLIVLDGLDEIASASVRVTVVDQINRMVRRLAGSEVAKRHFQVLVTARPNASGLPEPDRSRFQTIVLEPLPLVTQQGYVTKWATVHGVTGQQAKNLKRIFNERVRYEHVAQLANNPMQLTILLHLINKQGEAVPVSRTPIYSEYMKTLLDREINNGQIAKDDVRHILETTSFLGWHMQSGIEAEPGLSQMSKEDIEDTLVLYYRKTDGPAELVQKLFSAVTDRFWAMTSKLQGTFEFAVQPVREYFAAEFLAEFAGQHLREPIRAEDVLRELVERPYWLNTARFYAGFANPNELAGLRYGLASAIEGGLHPLQERTAVWTLLSDGIFHDARLPVQKDVVSLLADDLSVRLVAARSGAGNFPALSASTGGALLVDLLMKAVEDKPGDRLAPERIRVIRERVAPGTVDLRGLVAAKLDNALGGQTESSWLQVGACLGIKSLTASQSDRLALGGDASIQSALAAGACPTPGTSNDDLLMAAVLDGRCSDVDASGSSEAADLLRAIRPQWFIELALREQGGRASISGTDHFVVTDRDRPLRTEAFRSLIQIDSRYESLRRAADSRGKGQKGTTERWQNPARHLADLHDACWLAADIAVIGASTRDTRAEGTFTRGASVLGDCPDYGQFVMTVRRGGAPWDRWIADFRDELSARTIAFALVACASENDVVDGLAQTVEALTESQFMALAASSSRLGQSTVPRRLRVSALAATRGRSPRVQLLVSHYVASLTKHDPLEPLSDTDLLALAPFGAASWPAARAILARIWKQPNATLVEALSRLDPLSRVPCPDGRRRVDQTMVMDALANPSRYPSSWVIAAEAVRSRSVADEQVEAIARRSGWAPRIPRS